MSTQEGPGLGAPDSGEPAMFITGPDGSWLLPDSADYNLLSEQPAVLSQEALFDEYEAEIKLLEAAGEIEPNPLATPEFEDEPEVTTATDRPRRKDPANEELFNFRSHRNREGGRSEPGWRIRTRLAVVETDDDRDWLREMETRVAIEGDMADMFEARDTEERLGSMAARLASRFEIDEFESEETADPAVEESSFLSPLSVRDYLAFKGRGKAPIVDLSAAHPPVETAIAA